MNVLPLGPLSPPRFAAVAPRGLTWHCSRAPHYWPASRSPRPPWWPPWKIKHFKQNSGVSGKYAGPLLTLEWRISDFVADLPSALPSPPSSRRRLGRRSLTSCLLPRCLVPFLPSSLARWVFSFNVVRSFFLDSSHCGTAQQVQLHGPIIGRRQAQTSLLLL